MLFDWCKQLSVHPKLREISEEEAFPDRFASPRVLANPPSKKYGKTLRLAVDIEEPLQSNPELERDASRRLRV